MPWNTKQANKTYYGLDEVLFSQFYLDIGADVHM